MRRSDISALLRPEMAKRGWQPRGDGFVLPLDADGHGVLSWSGSQRGTGYWVGPAIGYHHVAVQRLLAKLLDQPYRTDALTVRETLAYLVPGERPESEWRFGTGSDEVAAREIATIVEEHGTPFVLDIHRRGLPRIRQLVEAGSVAAEWIYPPVLLLMGHKDLAQALVQRRLRDVKYPDGDFGRAYRAFADRLRAAAAGQLNSS